MNHYKEYLYQIIENNKIEILPEQELIDSDKRIAKAIWNNYRETDDSIFGVDSDDYEDRFYTETVYKKKYDINFREILNKYLIDLEFWNELNLVSLILDEDFRNTFNELVELYCSKKENLDFAYQKTKNYFYIDKIEQLEGNSLSLEKLKEDYLLSNRYTMKDNEKLIDFIKKSNNTNFLINLMKINNKTYNFFNEEMKNNAEIIEILPKYPNLFDQLNSDLKLKLYKKFDFSYFELKELSQIENELLLKILENNKNKNKVNVLLSKKLINNDNFDKLINTDQEIVDILNSKNKKEFEEKIKEKLKIWINDFSFKSLTEKEKILIEYCSYYKLNLNNLDIKISEIISKNQKINKEIFFEYTDYLFKKLEEKEINQEYCEKKLISLKKILPPEIQKEWKIKDNEIFSTLFKKILEKNIINNKKNIKIKI